MPLISAKPPDRAFQLISESLNQLASTGSLTVIGTFKDLDTTEVSVPIQVYVLGLKDLREELKGARSRGWRYLVFHENQAVAAAEIDDTGGGELEFSHLNSGPFVGETVETIIQAEKIDAVKDNDYEIRILEIPGLYVIALWLHNDTDDILIPMLPAGKELVARKSYTAKEFFSSLLETATKRLAFDDSPKDDPPREE